MTDPPNGESQRTVLAAGAAVDPRDYTEDLETAASLSLTGGAICFVSSSMLIGTIDCVEWGSGNTNVNADPPVLPGGIPEGSSITRSIAPGCSTLLEASDDTENSAADFSQTSPTPRANTQPIVETECAPGGGSPTPAVPKKKKCKRKKKKGKAAARGKGCKKKKKKGKSP